VPFPRTHIDAKKPAIAVPQSTLAWYGLSGGFLDCGFDALNRPAANRACSFRRQRSSGESRFYDAQRLPL
jgi:hypothetical protein